MFYKLFWLMSQRLVGKIQSKKLIHNKNVSKVHGCPARTIIFYVQWTVKLVKKANLALELGRSYHREHVY